MARPTTKVGNIVTDPELRFSTKGTAWTRFRLAFTPWDPETKKMDKERTEFYTVRAFRDLAEHVCESLGKGDRVIVQGDGETEEYTKNDGTPGKQKVILANAVGAELRFATVDINRIKRTATVASYAKTDPYDEEPF